MRSGHATVSCSTPVPMSIGDAASAGAGGKDRNKVLNELPALGAAHFICREPRYLGSLRRGFWVLLGGGLACSALLAPAIPWPLAVLFWIASGLALLAAIRPAPCSIHFASDAQGLFFPSRQRFATLAQARSPSWLFVPWANVSAIGVQLLLDDSGSRQGVTFSLRACEKERRVYFPGTAIPAVDARLPADDRALIGVGYPGASVSLHKIVAQLRALQGQSTSLAAD